MHAPPKCLRCQAPMKEGFQLDRTHHATVQTTWNEGEPQVHKVLGIPTNHLKREDGAARIPVTTFRCPSCGYLESYAFSDQTQQK